MNDAAKAARAYRSTLLASNGHINAYGSFLYGQDFERDRIRKLLTENIDDIIHLCRENPEYAARGITALINYDTIESEWIEPNE